MNKLFILLLCLISIPSITKADDDKPVTVNELPKETQAFIKKHFADTKISYAKIESDFFKKEYEVIFVNGQKAEFDQNGTWKEIDCKYSSVPASIIPEAIKKHLTEQFPGQTVIKIERDKKGYEIKLKNKLELKFNHAFQLTGTDD